MYLQVDESSEEWRSKLHQEKEIGDIRILGDTVEFRYSGDYEKLIQILGEFEKISDITIKSPTLEEIFLQYYEYAGSKERRIYMSFINKTHVNLFIKPIKKDRWLLIGLFIGIFFTVFLVGITFPADDPNQLQGFDELLENPVWQGFLGSLINLSTLQGWFAMGWFSISWWIGIPFALYLGIQIFANEITQGTADHLLTAPVSRREVLVIRYVSAALELLMIPLSTFLGISLTFLFFNINFPLLDTISVVTLDYVFFLTAMSFTLFFSLILVDIKHSLILTGVIYIISYLFQVFGSLNPDLEILRDFSIFETRPLVEIFVTSATEKILPNFSILIVLSCLLFVISFFIIERVEIRKR